MKIINVNASNMLANPVNIGYVGENMLCFPTISIPAGSIIEVYAHDYEGSI